MPGFFKDVEGEGAIVSVGGVFKQVGVAVRDHQIYVKWGGGYVRLMADGSTSKTGVAVHFLTWDGPLAQQLGRLCTPDHPGSKVLPPPAVAKLLGAPNADA